MIINENGYSEATPFKIFELLTNTAQLEYVLSEMFKHLLSQKQRKWLADKDESSSRLTELGEVIYMHDSLIITSYTFTINNIQYYLCLFIIITQYRPVLYNYTLYSSGIMFNGQSRIRAGPGYTGCRLPLPQSIHSDTPNVYI